MLSAGQLAQFETFGFVHLRALFTAAEMTAITASAEAIWRQDLEEGGGEEGHQGVVSFIERRPALAHLPEDDRIWGPVGQVAGAGFVWGGSEGNKGSFNETRDHQWHSDRAGQIDLAYRRVKIMIYLQAMCKDTGALRVIPGSHQADFHRRLLVLQPQGPDTSMDVFGVAGPDLPSYPVEVEPGDVVLFDHYLYHGVYGKQERRSYIAMKFAARPQTEVHYRALQAHGQGAEKLHEDFRHSQRPRIRAMVEGLLEWERRAEGAAV
ncbi:MAG: hypothetical protein GKR89_20635 [Candidatus Latescibacteria bacterium]|nr:hypothetical protein [Candidatus Latescibacterota bacterium]